MENLFICFRAKSTRRNTAVFANANSTGQLAKAFSLVEMLMALPKRARLARLGLASEVEGHGVCSNARRGAGRGGQLRKPYHVAAFSLVEMLMALLVASLLMVALAPVMTKKFNETISIGGGNQFVHEVAYNSPYCPVGAEPKTYDDGTEYCEGEFTVPMGVNKIEVTLVGGGGGGAAAATAGIWERKEPGTEDFKVPEMVNELEVTLVSGGSAGGAGGQVLKNVTFVADGKGGVTEENDANVVEQVSTGEKDWTIPEELKGKYAKVTGCGGGGGAGGAWFAGSCGNSRISGGGGSGAYIENEVVTMPDDDTIKVTIGGGGGRGAIEGGTDSRSGRFYGGGGGSSWKPSSLSISPLQEGTFGMGGYGSGPHAYRNFFPGGKGGMGGGGDGEDNFYIDDDGVKKYKNFVSHPTDPPSSSSRAMAGGAGNGGGNGGCGARGSINEAGNDGFSAAGGGGGGGLIGAGGGGGALQGGGGGGGRTALGSIFVAPGGGGGTGTTLGGGGGGGAGQTVDGTGKGGAGANGTIATRKNINSCGTSVFQGGFGGTPNGGNADYNIGGVAGIVVGSEKKPTIFGNNYCNGSEGMGNAGSLFFEPVDRGKDGALRLTYLTLGPGGSGGGTGQQVPVRPLNVTAGETLSVQVGEEKPAKEGGEIESNGTVRDPDKLSIAPTAATLSILKRGTTEILYTTPSGGIGGYGNFDGCSTGVLGSSRYCSSTGGTYTGADPFNGITIAGFRLDKMGNAANNVQVYGEQKHPNGSTGGSGGGTLLFGKRFCEGGYGGKTKYIENGITKEHPPEGGDATGCGGCGGGGGYAFHKSGKGAPGYARISWNKSYKRGSADEYEYPNGGSGGGGSAGNAFRYSIKVQGGDVLKYKVGKGGTGGGWTLVEKTIGGVKKSVLEQVLPTNGGMTELKTANNEILRAGGGLAGAFPLLNAIVVNPAEDLDYNKDGITYGLGGAAPNLCEFVNSKGETESFIDKEKLCTNKAGADGTAAGGGKGADAGFGAGTGGAAGATGGKVAANGSPAVGFGAGGGGAGLADLGTVNATDAVANPTVGGNGGDGKIIFRWK